MLWMLNLICLLYTSDRPIDNTGECSICKSEKIYFEKGYCVYPYAGAVRNTILNFKFKNMALYYTYLGSKRCV